MAYEVIVLPAAETDLAQLEATTRARVLRRIVRLGEQAEHVVHHRLAGMPNDLAGLCRLRAGDYRVLYWPRTADRRITIYRIQHRREVYRRL